MNAIFRRSQTPHHRHTRRRPRQRTAPTWEERAQAALAAAREVEEAAGETVPTRPAEVNASRRLCYGPQYVLPGTHHQDAEASQNPYLQREEQCKMVQSNVALDLSSLHLFSVMIDSPAVTQSPFFTLSFTVNSLVPVSINLYWLAIEDWSVAAETGKPYPRFVSRVNRSGSYQMPAGCNQRFVLPREDWLQAQGEPYCTLMSSDWQERDMATAAIPMSDSRSSSHHSIQNVDEDAIELKAILTKTDDEIQEIGLQPMQKTRAYGLVIELIEQTPEGNSQISYVDFFQDGPAHLVPRCIKQKLCIDGVLYIQHEIYGLSEAMRAHMDDSAKDDVLQCAICLSDDKDTVLLPCRHLCMCRECANTYRQQSNKCPICRRVVESILHIQNTKEHE